jgi:hypothetical protein
MDEVKEPSNFEYYTPLIEPYRLYFETVHVILSPVAAL